MRMEKKISHLNNKAKMDNFKMIVKHISNAVDYNLFDKESIEDFNKNDYEMDIVDGDSEMSEDVEGLMKIMIM